MGDLVKSRRPAQSTETHGSSPMTQASWPGRDLEGIAAHHLQRGAVGHLHVQMPRHHIAEVVDLAALGTNNRLDMLGPAPAWLEDRASDGQLPKLD